MATAAVPSGTVPRAVSDEEKRWMVIGICLTKVLTPPLRDVLTHEMPKWYQTLVHPPQLIDKQSFKGGYMKSFPPSTMPLNYASINNNFALHKSSHRNYDYAVKDPVSLAKLFMKPFMASFTAFDQTMDTSAALSVVAEADPFRASGAGASATKIRSDVRNEWAHCNFAHWTDVNYRDALKEMELLINNVNLTPVNKKRVLDDLCAWEKKGLDLCLGQPVDPALLNLVQKEVASIRDEIECWKEDEEYDKKQLLDALENLKYSLEKEIEDLKERQRSTEQNVEDLRERQRRTEQDVEQQRQDQLALYEKVASKVEEPQYLFQAPKQSEWFSGRASELELLRGILEKENVRGDEKVIVAAVSGLGGSGKTSLVAQYTHDWKHHYQGGVYWFSAEDDVKLKYSVDDIAAQFNTLHENSLDATLSKTLAVISRITKPWLMVVDDMDELCLSQNLLKLISGSWQANVSSFGHLIITTRRKPLGLTEDIPGFKESKCLKLECFGHEEAKNFLFKRTGTPRDETTESIADDLIQKLGGLPLALEQACAYIKYLDCTLPVYLETYEKQSLQLLNKKKANPVYGTSPERLAVCTTWLLNFEHIRKKENGMIAIRFLNASAFMNPNEIQDELINIGEPHVEDEAYCEHVNTPLGRREVLKLLTDFSLFKETRNSSLCVHRLVQDVIRENLEPDEKVESLVDAARLLRFAFSNCSSPDLLLKSVIDESHDRSSLYSTDLSRFYKWNKLCLHTYEIKNNLVAFLNLPSQVKKLERAFLPELARILYECALHLNVNNSCSEAKTVADLANRILEWGDDVVSEEMLKALFPQTIPLSESVRRLIQYSCRAPVEMSSTSNSEISSDDSMKSEIETKRLEGNKVFKQGNFEEAVKIYTSCIVSSKGTDSFDPKLLSNRASAYLELKQYKEALNDAHEYIKYSPECWRGYARKALALHGLGEKWDAVCAAAMAFYRIDKIFDDYAPFKALFAGLKQRIHICASAPSLVSSLSNTGYKSDPYFPSKVIVLEPGNYRLSVDDFGSSSILEDKEFNVKRLLISDCILLGVVNTCSSSDAGVTLSFLRNLGIGVRSHKFIAVNISVFFELGNLFAYERTEVNFCNSSFTSNNSECSFVSEGSICVRECEFSNSRGTALYVLGETMVEDSVFSGNESVGLKVGLSKTVVNNSKLYGNQWGLDVRSSTCIVTGCQIYDNKKIGIGVGNGEITLTRNEIFHNDRHGIYLCERSSAFIMNSDVFENGGWGISTASDSWCNVSENKIFQNKCGGIRVTPISKKPGHRPSTIQSNQIFGNGGPGISQKRTFADEIGSPFPSTDDLLRRDEDLLQAICTGNKLKENIEEGCPPPAQDVCEICFFCRKQGHLKKCTKCFTAAYCNAECQKSDWKKHKGHCVQLLKKNSLLVKVLPKYFGPECNKENTNDSKYTLQFRMHIKAPFSWLQPSGPKYAEAPKKGKRFIVKIQAGDCTRRSNPTGVLLVIEDRSLTINGDLDMHEHSGRIYHLVRECGSNCGSLGWKKKFLWALLEKKNLVRLFISDFPPYQFW